MDRYNWLKQRHKISGFLFVAMLFLFFISPEIKGDVSTAAIDPHIWKLLETRKQVDILVVLKEQAELSGALTLETKIAKGQFVYQRLTETAERTQPPLRTYLDNNGIPYRSYWIRNMIRIQADVAQIEELVRLPVVDHIEYLYPAELEPIVITGPQPEEQPSAVEWNIQRVHADDVWNTLGITGIGVVVGIIDSGVEWTHSALINQYRSQIPGAPTRHDYNWYDGPNGSLFPVDYSGHGTSVTGVIVGDDNDGNQIGMAPSAQWIACAMIGGNSTPIDCLQFMLAPTKLDGSDPRPDLSPHLISNSWRAGIDYSDIIYTLYLAGIHFVKAGENEGSDCGTVHVPGDLPFVTAVGAFAPGDIITSFSSRGPMLVNGELVIKPDLTAPGLNIRTSRRGGGYTNGAGTSLACPHVAGAVALILSARSELVGKVDLQQMILKESSVPMIDLQCQPNDPSGVPNNVWGYGILDSYDAVLMALEMGLGEIEGNITDGGTTLPLAGTDLIFEDVASNGKMFATSGVDGSYSHILPSATYTLTARAYGYLTETISGVTVITNLITTQDMSLTPLPTYVISGTITDLETGAPLSATINVLNTPLSPIQNNPVTGYYSVTVSEGEYTLHPETPRYMSKDHHLVVDHNQTQDFKLVSIPYMPNEDNPILEPGAPGSWDSRIIASPSAVFIDDEYYLFYVGDNPPSNIGAIGYATSTDGVQFTKYEGNPILMGDGSGFDADWAAYPVVLVEDNTWIIYYAGWASGGQVQIGRATAQNPNGPWTRSYNPILSPGSYWEWDGEWLYADSVISTESGYLMNYTGDSYPGISSKIGMATSANGLIWTKYDDPGTPNSPFAESDPVLRPGSPGTWDHRIIKHSDIRKTDNGWEMFYTGYGTFLDGAIGYVTSQDGILWTRPDDNPILRLIDDPAATWIRGPDVIQVDSTDWLYYDTNDGICVAMGSICFSVEDLEFTWEPIVPSIEEVVSFTAEVTGTMPITFTWNFGDGDLEHGAQVTHTYSWAGNYKVTATATNRCGMDVFEAEISVVEPPCNPVNESDFTWTPITPKVEQTVAFTGTANGSTPIEFTWDFGDGITVTDYLVTHAFANAGTYTVTLKVTNACGEQVVAKYIDIVAAPPVWDVYLPVVIR
jgi:subtilisin family serine protease